MLELVVIIALFYPVLTNTCTKEDYFAKFYVKVSKVVAHRDISVSIDTKKGFYQNAIVSQSSRVVDIHFEISYPSHKCCLILFFTFHEGNRHVENECFVGQSVLEKDTRYSRGFIHLRPGVHSSGCSFRNSNILCISSTKLQSYKPRNWFFTLGYQCEKVKGLKASVSMSVESTNQARGEYLREPVCQKYYKQASFPNFVGHTLQDEAKTMFNVFRAIFLESNCHQHLEEFLCRIFFFEYRGTQVFPICKRSCQETIEGCWPTLKKYDIPLNCKYLPNNSEECYYKPVDCGTPTNLENGLTFYKNTTYGSNAEYSCNTGYFLAGNISTSRCEYSGKWTHVNIACIQDEWHNDLLHKRLFNIEISVHVLHMIIILIVFVSVLSTIFIIIRNQIEISLIYYIRIQKFFKKRRGQIGDKAKQYEAFISYASSKETDSFVMDTMTTHLETDEHVKLRLFLHHRDYLVGNLIVNNILNGIQESKTAVILLNQEYIQQKWCIFEFAHCHKQLVDDSNFKIIIVLMQPVDTLQSIPRTIKAFLNTTTYICKDDPRFWARLIHAIVT